MFAPEKQRWFLKLVKWWLVGLRARSRKPLYATCWTM
ncbi:hypothetical protein L916_09545 [Phytophthora nicotianae]|uniref:Uncharacterized protein n=1 Tax=Phytophthora nicotianae TaxID=4792 RepID=W2J068_PHYNI|nr:hypothetical protein L916_09545 [Phytophthora nicotianae]